MSYPNMPPPFEPGSARPMNPEFGRRIRSFLIGSAWWEIAQLVRSEVGEDSVWKVMVAGIGDPEPSAEDIEFARSLNWGVNRRDIDLTNVETYTYPGGNWWYVDQDQAAPGRPEATVVVWGRVLIALREQQDKHSVQAKAKDFGRAMIRREDLLDVEASAEEAEIGGRMLVSGTVVIGHD